MSAAPRLHESVSVSAADSLGAVIERLRRDGIPTDEFRQLAFLCDARRVLFTALVGATAATADARVRSLIDAGGVRQLRDAFRRLADTDATRLAAISDGELLPGWNRLLLVWLVAAHAAALLVAIGRDDGAADYVPVRAAVLRRNELASIGRIDPATGDLQLTGRGTPVAVGAYTASELRDAIAALASRADIIELRSADEAAELGCYVSALETRAGVLALRTADAAVADVFEWRSRADTGLPSREFVATMAYTFVALRAYATAPAVIGALAAHPLSTAALGRGDAWRVRPPDTDPDRATRHAAAVDAVIRFIVTYARSQRTDEHAKTFSTVALASEAWPGELAVYQHIYGQGGAERATVISVLLRERPDVVSSTTMFSKYQRSLAEWIDSAAERRRLAVDDAASAGNASWPVSHGAPQDMLVERLAILHAVNAYFVGALNAGWADWYVCLARRAGDCDFAIEPPPTADAAAAAASFPKRAALAFANGAPLIVQVGGQLAVWTGSETGGAVGRPAVRRRRTRPYQLLPTTDAFDAVARWADATLDVTGGRLHSTSLNAAPLLRAMLGRADARAADDSSADRARHRRVTGAPRMSEASTAAGAAAPTVQADI